MKATDAQIEAVANADAHLTNAILPSYSELAAALRWIAAHPSYQALDLKKIAGDIVTNMPQLCPPTYTEEYEAEGGGHSLSIRCAAGTDLDGRFAAWDVDNNELIYVNGWLFSFDPKVKYVVQNDAGLYYGKPGGDRKWVASMYNAETMSQDSAKHIASVERGFYRLFTG